MINLLPTEAKQSISYARRNTMLIRWSFALLASLGIVAVISIFGYIYIQQAISDTKQQVATTQEQLKVQKLEDTQKRVQNISSSLKLVIQVLSKQVLFSSLLQQIGAAMPPNTVLTNLSINKLQGGIDLQVAATDYEAATQVQINLKDPKNQIFSDADLINSQCGIATGTNGKYPCTVTIRAKFSTNNPFLFINRNGATTAGPAGASQ